VARDNGAEHGWLGGLADEADRFVQGRIDNLATTARERSSQFAEHAAESFARHLAETVAQRLATQLAWAVVAIGSLLIAVWLLALGVASAIGEALGRPSLGQLVAGAIMLLVAVAAGASIRRRARRRRAEDARTADDADVPGEAAPEPDEPDPASNGSDSPGQQALQAGTDLLRRHPLASAAALAAVGVLVGLNRSRSKATRPAHPRRPRSAARPPA